MRRAARATLVLLQLCSPALLGKQFVRSRCIATAALPVASAPARLPGPHPAPSAALHAAAGMGGFGNPAAGDYRDSDDDDGPPPLEGIDDDASKPPPLAGNKAAMFGGLGGLGAGAGASAAGGGDLSDDDDDGPPGLLEEGAGQLHATA